MTNTNCCEYSIKNPDDSKSSSAKTHTFVFIFILFIFYLLFVLDFCLLLDILDIPVRKCYNKFIIIIIIIITITTTIIIKS
jgi:hypothetical protein